VVHQSSRYGLEPIVWLQQWALILVINIRLINKVISDITVLILCDNFIVNHCLPPEGERGHFPVQALYGERKIWDLCATFNNSNTTLFLLKARGMLYNMLNPAIK